MAKESDSVRPRNARRSGPARLSLRIRTEGKRLMHHQCWLLGRDIWHPDGNLLTRYGFKRFGVPESQTGSNAYRLRRESGSEIIVWGFGMFCGDGHGRGVFVRRYGFSPVLLTEGTLVMPIWNPDLLVPLRSPVPDPGALSALLKSLVRWVIDYEEWVRTTAGRDWRDACLGDWSGAELGADEIESGWKRLFKMLSKV